MAYVVTNFGQMKQLDQTSQLLRTSRQQLEVGHSNLKTLRRKVLPTMERKLIEAEHSFHQALKLADMPIPKLAPDIPVGLITGAVALFFMGSIFALMLYVDSKEEENDEPQETRRRRKKPKRTSRPRPV